MRVGGFDEAKIEITLRAAKWLQHRLGGHLSEWLVMNVFVIKARKHARPHRGVADHECRIVKCQGETTFGPQRLVKTLKTVVEQCIINLKRFFLAFVANDFVRYDILRVVVVRLQPGVPEIGKLAILDGRIVGRVSEDVIRTLIWHFLHQLHAVISDHGNVCFSGQHLAPVIRHFYVAQKFVGFVLGINDSLMTGYCTFKFLPDV